MGSFPGMPAVLLALAILFAVIWIAAPSFAAAAPEKTVRATILYKDAAGSAKATVAEKKSSPEDISAKALRAGGKIKHKFAAINAVSAEFTESGLSEIERDPRVIVERSKPVYAFLQESVPLIRANDTWARSVSGQNITGAGTSVCVIDTGVDYNHTDLGSGWGNKVIAGYNAIAGQDCSSNNAACFDDNGHGTHVSGIVAANGSINGVAPGVKIVAVKALYANGSGNSLDVIAGIDWCTANAATYNISAISMSLGGGFSSSFCDSTDPVTAASINTAVAKNISVIVATGNDADYFRVSYPACIQNSTRVGATYDANIGGISFTGLCSDATTQADKITCYTDRGINFPDMLLAPGSAINSTLPGNTYGVEHGTSMSAPHVSGAIALLSQAYKTKHGGFPAPSFLWSALNLTGERIHDSRTGLNFSRINVLAALDSFTAVKIISSYNNITGNASGDIAINETKSIFFNVSADQDASYFWYLNSTLQNSTQNNFTWHTGYNDSGTWAVLVAASNGYLNSSFQWNVTVLDVPLNITSFYPAVNFSAAENSTTYLNVTTSRNTIQNTWLLDGSVFSNSSQNASISWSCTSAGIHNVSYTGSDGFDTVVQNWTANITGIICPQIEVFAKNYTTDDFVFINASISESSDSCILYFGANAYAMRANVTSCTYNVTSVNPATYNFSVFANDSAGNRNRTGNFSVQVFFCLESYSDWSGCTSGKRERSHTLRDCSVVSEQESCQSQPAGGSGGYGDSIPQKNNTNNTASAGNNTFLNASLAILNGTGNTRESVLYLNISGENDGTGAGKFQETTAPAGESPKEVPRRAEGGLQQSISGILREAGARIFSGSILEAERASGTSRSILNSMSSSITVAGKIASGAVRTLFGWIFKPFV